MAENRLNADDILNLLKRDHLVKVLSSDYQLPSSSGLKFRVDDYRAISHYDDDYYKQTKSLYLRRGVAAVYAIGGGDKMNTRKSDQPNFLLTGIPKFGYCEDSYTEPPNFDVLKCQRSVYTMKENGEAGHLAFFQLNDKWFAIVGSKNVHIVLSVANEAELMADINYYAAMNSVRLKVALANIQLLVRFHKDLLLGDGGKEMKRFLYDNKLTIVFEAIFDNHIVKYDEHAVIAFALASPQFSPVEQQGLVELPEISLKKFTEWGFRVPTNDLAKDLDTKTQLDRKYEKLDNSEGAVIYEVHLNEATGREVVAKMYKHKNHIYIVRRMARELIKRKASFQSWRKRFAEIHIDVDAGLQQEIDQLLAFYVYLSTTFQPTPFNQPTSGWSDLVQENFKNWLDEFKKSKSFGEFDKLKAEASSAANLTTGPNSNLNSELAIVLVGLQGSGKTLLRNGLVKLLGDKRAAYVNQDELGGERKVFLRKLRSTKDSGKIVVVDKCNHVYSLREDVYSTYSKVLIVEFVHPTGEMESLCEERIKIRGAKHLTMPFSSEARSIIGKCAQAYEPVSDIEKLTNDYLSLNPTEAPEVNVLRVIEFLRKNGFVDANLHIDSGHASKEMKEIQKNYEDRILREAIKKCKYWRASANVETFRNLVKPFVEAAAILPETIVFKWQIPDDCNPNQWSSRNREEYHVTLVYERKLGLKEAEKYLQNVEITVKAVSIAYDDNCAAVRIAKDGRIAQLCDKECPHITIGCAKGVSPTYANDMLKRGDFKEIPCDFEIQLVIQPVQL